MVRTVEELAADVRKVVGDDNNSDEVIELLENITDTVNASNANEYNKEKFDALDREWRERYTRRFMGEVDKQRENEDEKRVTDMDEDETDEVKEDIKIDDLFGDKEDK